tara:strand:+ start:1178 stop:2686 length:1509 start_codon:yes stop_codon:yes gene_type:complete
MMNKIDNSGTGIAKLGRDEDNYLAHVAAGEMVVPPVITPETRQRLEQEMMSVGLDPNEYTVGSGMSINPITGNPEFLSLKKIAKGLKKVVKKIAPVAAVIPGPWQAPAIVYNKGNAALKLAKGEGGIGDIMTVMAGGSQKVFGKDGALQSIKSGDFLKAGGGFKDALTGIGSIDGKFKPLQYGRNIGQQYMDDQKSGYFGLFGGGEEPLPEVTMQDSFGGPTYELADGTPISRAELESRGYSFDAKGNPIASTQTSGGFLDGKSPMEFLSAKLLPQGVEDALGTGPGGTFGGGTASSSGAGGGMGNLAVAGLAGLIGKLAYEEAKKNKGVPLTPLTTTDQLGRYNIAAEIARQKGEEMPSRVEFGLNPQGMPALQGGMPRSAAMGGMMYSQADGDHNGIMGFANGGVVAMQEGGEPPIDPANFPVMDGQIDGPGTETSDDIPAMLSDGEFVMTAKAVKGAGSFDVATNDSNGIVTLTPNGDPSRDSGTRVMYKLMEHFGSMA